MREKRKVVKSASDYERDSYLPKISSDQVKAVLDDLGLRGEHYVDYYIAQYHINFPEYVNSTNYLNYLSIRESQMRGDEPTDSYHDVRHKPNESAPCIYRNQCDTILCEMENDTFHDYGALTPKQIRTILDIILHGVSGAEDYFSDIDEMKKESPETYSIWDKLTNILNANSKERQIKNLKKNMQKRIEAMQLLEEVDSIRPNVSPEKLFDEKYKTFVFYNTKYSRVIICTCTSIDDRWKGTKTMQGDVVKFVHRRQKLHEVVSCRSVNSLLKINKRMLVKDTVVRMAKDMILLKAFKK